MDLNKLLFWRRKTPAIVEKGASTGSTAAITASNIKKFVVKAAGQVSTQQSGDFAEPEHALSEIKRAVNADSYIKLSILKYSQLIFKAGYSITSKNDAATQYINNRLRLMSFMTGVPMDVIFEQIASDLVTYSNAFLIKSRLDGGNIAGIQAKGVLDTKPVGGYFRVDPTTVQIKRDKNGTIKQYQQSVDNEDKKYKATDVIHFYIDREGGNAFGTPRIEAALEDVKLLRKIEGNVLKLVYRYSAPLTQMKIGIPEAGLMATDKEIAEAKAEVERLADDGIMITNERTEFKSIGAEGTALDASKYLDYFEKRVFSALNLSSTMVGRNSAKQDADSMEEQVHDAVKHYQKNISTFIENYIFTELLLEGGFNPVSNPDDIVNFKFHEINLDTRVKMEAHAVNKFQGNAITFVEMRNALGLGMDEVDTEQLYANMIQKTNELELLNAKASLSTSFDKPGPDPKSKQSSTIDNHIKPENQHGKTTAKIKEVAESITEEENPRVQEYRKKFSSLYKKYNSLSNDLNVSNEKRKIVLSVAKSSLEKEIEKYIIKEAQVGYEQACKDIGQRTRPGYTLGSGLLMDHVKQILDKLFNYVQEKLKEENADPVRIIDSTHYRVRFLVDEILSKAKWYAYVRTCAELGVYKVYVDFGNSKDKEDHKEVINTKHFTLKDIPAYHAYCSCQVKLDRAQKER